MTDAEKRLWWRINNRKPQGAKFVRQFPIGRAVADFAARSERLVIELDGGQHAENAADTARTAMIEAHGYQVLRFWNHEVMRETDAVVARIRHALLIARNRAAEW